MEEKCWDVVVSGYGWARYALPLSKFPDEESVREYLDQYRGDPTWKIEEEVTDDQIESITLDE